ncbi:OTU domain-containing protein 3-like [Lithobates pipiens]
MSSFTNSTNPLWHIRGSDKSGARELHIAYRYGEHYDSVRRINDNAETPANLQTETLSKDESNRKGKQKSNSSDERRGDAVQKVRNATGCAVMERPEPLMVHVQ